MPIECLLKKVKLSSWKTNSSLKKELADASTSDVYRSCKEESDALKVENFRLKKELGEAYIRH
jgi:hypothetical protein